MAVGVSIHPVIDLVIGFEMAVCVVTMAPGKDADEDEKPPHNPRYDVYLKHVGRALCVDLFELTRQTQIGFRYWD